MAAVEPAGGAGEESLNSVVVVKGQIRAIPYSVIERAVKAGVGVGKGATGARQIVVRGKPMIYKSGPPGIVANEYIAYQLFAAMGARVPASYLVVNVEAGGIPMAVMTELLEGAITAKDAYRALRTGKRTELKLAIQDEFVYHALLLNWDAKNWENHMILPSSGAEGVGFDIYNPYVVDPGGALFYRAMGEPKRAADLSPFEIQELTIMPALSVETRGKFYDDLRDPGALRTVVCRKAALIDDATVMATVEGLRPLFGYLPRGADLPGLIAGRLNYLRKFCAGEIDPVEINRSALFGEAYGIHSGKGSLRNPLTGMPEEETAATNIVRRRYTAKVRGLEEEATEGLRMRGKRAVMPVTALEPGNLEDWFRLYNRPVVRERRHAGVDKYGFEYNSNSNSNSGNGNGNGSENSEKRGVYPKPHVTVRLNRSADAERVRHAVLAAREDPAIDAWLRAQVAFIKGLSVRDYNILSSYTRNGDVMVNNYLRGTLREDSADLILASLEVTPQNPVRPVALAYSIYDQFPALTRDGRLQLFKGAELQAGLLGEDGELDMELMRAFVGENIDYFGRTANLGPLIEQYRRDLVAIIERAPRPPHAFTVFRGINSEAHLSSLSFRNVDFLSTSISPEWAVRTFTREIKEPTGMVSRTYRCCVYELEVRPDVPCIYMQFVSEFPDEYEVLIAPGMSVSLEPTVRLKMVLDHIGGTLEMADLRRIFHVDSRRHTKVAVVEGEVRRPAGGPSAVTTPIPLEEEGSFEGMVFSKGVRRVSSAMAERFVEAKPRSQMVGRNRTRRFRTAWKMTANRNKHRETHRRSSSGSGGF